MFSGHGRPGAPAGLSGQREGQGGGAGSSWPVGARRILVLGDQLHRSLAPGLVCNKSHVATRKMAGVLGCPLQILEKW